MSTTSAAASSSSSSLLVPTPTAAASLSTSRRDDNNPLEQQHQQQQHQLDNKREESDDKTVPSTNGRNGNDDEKAQQQQQHEASDKTDTNTAAVEEEEEKNDNGEVRLEQEEAHAGTAATSAIATTTTEADLSSNNNKNTEEKEDTPATTTTTMTAARHEDSPEEEQKKGSSSSSAAATEPEDAKNEQQQQQQGSTNKDSVGCGEEEASNGNGNGNPNDSVVPVPPGDVVLVSSVPRAGSLSSTANEEEKDDDDKNRDEHAQQQQQQQHDEDEESAAATNNNIDNKNDTTFVSTTNPQEENERKSQEGPLEQSPDDNEASKKENTPSATTTNEDNKTQDDDKNDDNGENDYSRPFDIFISHAGEQKERYAKPLRKELHRRFPRLNVFLDSTSVEFGKPFPPQLQQACRQARLAIFILSPQFVVKKWPMEELGNFLDRHLQDRQRRGIITDRDRKRVQQRLQCVRELTNGRPLFVPLEELDHTDGEQHPKEEEDASYNNKEQEEQLQLQQQVFLLPVYWSDHEHTFLPEHVGDESTPFTFFDQSIPYWAGNVWYELNKRIEEGQTSKELIYQELSLLVEDGMGPGANGDGTGVFHSMKAPRVSVEQVCQQVEIAFSPKERASTFHRYRDLILGILVPLIVVIFAVPLGVGLHFALRPDELPDPTEGPTNGPSRYPSAMPSVSPSTSVSPSLQPTMEPSFNPSLQPSQLPSQSQLPSAAPTDYDPRRPYRDAPTFDITVRPDTVIDGTNVGARRVTQEAPAFQCPFFRIRFVRPVYHHFIGDGQCYSAGIEGADFDNVLGLLVGDNEALSVNCVTSNDEARAIFFRRPEISFSTVPDQDYRVIVGGATTGTGPYQLVVVETECDPSRACLDAPHLDLPHLANAPYLEPVVIVEDNNINALALSIESPALLCDDFFLVSRTLYYKFSGDDTCFRINTIGSEVDTVLGVLTISDDTSLMTDDASLPSCQSNSMTCIATSDNLFDRENGITIPQSEVTVRSIAGETYWIAVGGVFGSDAGAIQIQRVRVDCETPCQRFLDAQDLRELAMNETAITNTTVDDMEVDLTSFTIQGSNENVSVLEEEFAPARTCFQFEFSFFVVYYRMEGDGNCYIIDTVGSDFDTILGVVEGDHCNDLVCVEDNDDIRPPDGGPRPEQSQVMIATNSGTRYTVVVGGNGGVVGTFFVNVAEIDCDDLVVDPCAPEDDFFGGFFSPPGCGGGDDFLFGGF